MVQLLLLRRLLTNTLTPNTDTKRERSREKERVTTDVQKL